MAEQGADHWGIELTFESNDIAGLSKLDTQKRQFNDIQELANKAEAAARKVQSARRDLSAAMQGAKAQASSYGDILSGMENKMVSSVKTAKEQIGTFFNSLETTTLNKISEATKQAQAQINQIDTAAQSAQSLKQAADTLSNASNSLKETLGQLNTTAGSIAQVANALNKGEFKVKLEMPEQMKGQTTGSFLRGNMFGDVKQQQQLLKTLTSNLQAMRKDAEDVQTKLSQAGARTTPSEKPETARPQTRGSKTGKDEPPARFDIQIGKSLQESLRAGHQTSVLLSDLKEQMKMVQSVAQGSGVSGGLDINLGGTSGGSHGYIDKTGAGKYIATVDQQMNRANQFFTSLHETMHALREVTQRPMQALEGKTGTVRARQVAMDEFVTNLLTYSKTAARKNIPSEELFAKRTGFNTELSDLLRKAATSGGKEESNVLQNLISVLKGEARGIQANEVQTLQKAFQESLKNIAGTSAARHNVSFGKGGVGKFDLNEIMEELKWYRDTFSGKRFDIPIQRANRQRQQQVDITTGQSFKELAYQVAEQAVRHPKINVAGLETLGIQRSLSPEDLFQQIANPLERKNESGVRETSMFTILRQMQERFFGGAREGLGETDIGNFVDQMINTMTARESTIERTLSERLLGATRQKTVRKQPAEELMDISVAQEGKTVGEFLEQYGSRKFAGTQIAGGIAPLQQVRELLSEAVAKGVGAKGLPEKEAFQQIQRSKGKVLEAFLTEEMSNLNDVVSLITRSLETSYGKQNVGGLVKQIQQKHQEFVKLWGGQIEALGAPDVQAGVSRSMATLTDFAKPQKNFLRNILQEEILPKQTLQAGKRGVEGRDAPLIDALAKELISAVETHLQDPKSAFLKTQFERSGFSFEQSKRFIEQFRKTQAEKQGPRIAGHETSQSRMILEAMGNQPGLAFELMKTNPDPAKLQKTLGFIPNQSTIANIWNRPEWAAQNRPGYDPGKVQREIFEKAGITDPTMVERMTSAQNLAFKFGDIRSKGSTQLLDFIRDQGANLSGINPNVPQEDFIKELMYKTGVGRGQAEQLASSNDFRDLIQAINDLQSSIKRVDASTAQKRAGDFAQRFFNRREDIRVSSRKSQSEFMATHDPELSLGEKISNLLAEAAVDESKLPKVATGKRATMDPAVVRQTLENYIPLLNMVRGTGGESFMQGISELAEGISITDPNQGKSFQAIAKKLSVRLKDVGGIEGFWKEQAKEYADFITQREIPGLQERKAFTRELGLPEEELKKRIAVLEQQEKALLQKSKILENLLPPGEGTPGYQQLAQEFYQRTESFRVAQRFKRASDVGYRWEEAYGRGTPDVGLMLSGMTGVKERANKSKLFHQLQQTGLERAKELNLGADVTDKTTLAMMGMLSGAGAQQTQVTGSVPQIFESLTHKKMAEAKERGTLPAIGSTKEFLEKALYPYLGEIEQQEARIDKRLSYLKPESFSGLVGQAQENAFEGSGVDPESMSIAFRQNILNARQELTRRAEAGQGITFEEIRDILFEGDLAKESKAYMEKIVDQIKEPIVAAQEKMKQIGPLSKQQKSISQQKEILEQFFPQVGKAGRTISGAFSGSDIQEEIMRYARSFSSVRTPGQRVDVQSLIQPGAQRSAVVSQLDDLLKMAKVEEETLAYKLDELDKRFKATADKVKTAKSPKEKERLERELGNLQESISGVRFEQRATGFRSEYLGRVTGAIKGQAGEKITKQEIAEPTFQRDLGQALSVRSTTDLLKGTVAVLQKSSRGLEQLPSEQQISKTIEGNEGLRLIAESLRQRAIQATPVAETELPTFKDFISKLSDPIKQLESVISQLGKEKSGEAEGYKALRDEMRRVQLSLKYLGGMKMGKGEVGELRSLTSAAGAYKPTQLTQEQQRFLSKYGVSISPEFTGASSRAGQQQELIQGFPLATPEAVAANRAETQERSERFRQKAMSGSAYVNPAYLSAIVDRFKGEVSLRQIVGNVISGNLLKRTAVESKGRGKREPSLPSESEMFFNRQLLELSNVPFQAKSVKGRGPVLEIEDTPEITSKVLAKIDNLLSLKHPESSKQMERFTNIGQPLSVVQEYLKGLKGLLTGVSIEEFVQKQEEARQRSIEQLRENTLQEDQKRVEKSKKTVKDLESEGETTGLNRARVELEEAKKQLEETKKRIQTEEKQEKQKTEEKPDKKTAQQTANEAARQAAFTAAKMYQVPIGPGTRPPVAAGGPQGTASVANAAAGIGGGKQPPGLPPTSGAQAPGGPGGGDFSTFIAIISEQIQILSEAIGNNTVFINKNIDALNKNSTVVSQATQQAVDKMVGEAAAPATESLLDAIRSIVSGPSQEEKTKAVEEAKARTEKAEVEKQKKVIDNLEQESRDRKQTAQKERALQGPVGRGVEERGYFRVLQDFIKQGEGELRQLIGGFSQITEKLYTGTQAQRAEAIKQFSALQTSKPVGFSEAFRRTGVGEKGNEITLAQAGMLRSPFFFGEVTREAAEQFPQENQLNYARRLLIMLGSMNVQGKGRVETEKQVQQLLGNELNLYQQIQKLTPDKAQAISGHLKERLQNQFAVTGQERLPAMIPGTKTDYNKAIRDVKKVQAEAFAAERSVGKLVKGVANRVILYGGMSFALYGVIRRVTTAVQLMTQFEAAIVNVTKVMNPLFVDIERISDAARMLGKRFGSNIIEASQAMTVFAQQGKSAADVVSLAEASMLAANTTLLNSKEATEALTAALKQFNLETSDSITVLDAWNEVENRTAVTSKTLAQAVQQSGSAAKVAGISFHELNGMISAVGAATRQSGSQLGRAFRYIISHLKTDDAITAIQGLGIAVTNAQGEFRDAFEVLNDLAGSWGNLSSVQRQTAAITIAGTRRYNNLLVLMNRWNDVIKAVNLSLDSQGSSMRENEKVMVTVTKRFAQLKATTQGITTELGEAGGLAVLGEMTDQLKSIYELTQLIPKGLKGALATAGLLFGGGAIAFKSLRFSGLDTLFARHTEGFAMQRELHGRFQEQQKGILGSLQTPLGLKSEQQISKYVASLQDIKGLHATVLKDLKSINQYKVGSPQYLRAQAAAEAGLERIRVAQLSYAQAVQTTDTSLKGLANRTELFLRQHRAGIIGASIALKAFAQTQTDALSPTGKTFIGDLTDAVSSLALGHAFIGTSVGDMVKKSSVLMKMTKGMGPGIAKWGTVLLLASGALKNVMKHLKGSAELTMKQNQREIERLKTVEQSLDTYKKIKQTIDETGSAKPVDLEKLREAEDVLKRLIPGVRKIGGNIFGEEVNQEVIDKILQSGDQRTALMNRLREEQVLNTFNLRPEGIFNTLGLGKSIFEDQVKELRGQIEKIEDKEIERRGLTALSQEALKEGDLDQARKYLQKRAAITRDIQKLVDEESKIRQKIDKVKEPLLDYIGSFGTEIYKTLRGLQSTSDIPTGDLLSEVIDQTVVKRLTELEGKEKVIRDFANRIVKDTFKTVSFVTPRDAKELQDQYGKIFTLIEDRSYDAANGMKRFVIQEFDLLDELSGKINLTSKQFEFFADSGYTAQEAHVKAAKKIQEEYGNLEGFANFEDAVYRLSTLGDATISIPLGSLKRFQSVSKTLLQGVLDNYNRFKERLAAPIQLQEISFVPPNESVEESRRLLGLLNEEYSNTVKLLGQTPDNFQNTIDQISEAKLQTKDFGTSLKFLHDSIRKDNVTLLEAFAGGEVLDTFINSYIDKIEELPEAYADAVEQERKIRKEGAKQFAQVEAEEIVRPLQRVSDQIDQIFQMANLDITAKQLTAGLAGDAIADALRPSIESAATIISKIPTSQRKALEKEFRGIAQFVNENSKKLQKLSEGLLESRFAKAFAQDLKLSAREISNIDREVRNVVSLNLEQIEKLEGQIDKARQISQANVERIRTMMGKLNRDLVESQQKRDRILRGREIHLLSQGEQKAVKEYNDKIKEINRSLGDFKKELKELETANKQWKTYSDTLSRVADRTELATAKFKDFMETYKEAAAIAAEPVGTTVLTGDLENNIKQIKVLRKQNEALNREIASGRIGNSERELGQIEKERMRIGRELMRAENQQLRVMSRRINAQKRLNAEFKVAKLLQIDVLEAQRSLSEQRIADVRESAVVWQQQAGQFRGNLPDRLFKNVEDAIRDFGRRVKEVREQGDPNLRKSLLLASSQEKAAYDWIKAMKESGRSLDAIFGDVGIKELAKRSPLIGSLLDKLVREEENKQLVKAADKMDTSADTYLKAVTMFQFAVAKFLSASGEKPQGLELALLPLAEIAAQNKNSAFLMRTVIKRQSEMSRDPFSRTILSAFDKLIQEVKQDRQQSRGYMAGSLSYHPTSKGRLPGNRNQAMSAILHGQERVLSANEVDTYENMGIPGFANGTGTGRQYTKLNFKNLVDAVITHEGLVPKQTPFRIPKGYKKWPWKTILGQEVDFNGAKNYPDRARFVFVKTQEAVSKAVAEQFRRYQETPTHYGLPAKPTVKDLMELFDQSDSSGKMKFLHQRFGNIDKFPIHGLTGFKRGETQAYMQGSSSVHPTTDGRIPLSRSQATPAILHGGERVLSAQEVDFYEGMGIPGFAAGSKISGLQRYNQLAAEARALGIDPRGMKMGQLSSRKALAEWNQYAQQARSVGLNPHGMSLNQLKFNVGRIERQLAQKQLSSMGMKATGTKEELFARLSNAQKPVPVGRSLVRVGKKYPDLTGDTFNKILQVKPSKMQIGRGESQLLTEVYEGVEGSKTLPYTISPKKADKILQQIARENYKNRGFFTRAKGGLKGLKSNSKRTLSWIKNEAGRAKKTIRNITTKQRSAKEVQSTLSGMFHLYRFGTAVQDFRQNAQMLKAKGAASFYGEEEQYGALDKFLDYTEVYSQAVGKFSGPFKQLPFVGTASLALSNVVATARHPEDFWKNLTSFAGDVAFYEPQTIKFLYQMAQAGHLGPVGKTLVKGGNLFGQAVSTVGEKTGLSTLAGTRAGTAIGGALGALFAAQDLGYMTQLFGEFITEKAGGPNRVSDYGLGLQVLGKFPETALQQILPGGVDPSKRYKNEYLKIAKDDKEFGANNWMYRRMSELTAYTGTSKQFLDATGIKQARERLDELRIKGGFIFDLLQQPLSVDNINKNRQQIDSTFGVFNKAVRNNLLPNEQFTVFDKDVFDAIANSVKVKNEKHETESINDVVKRLSGMSLKPSLLAAMTANDPVQRKLAGRRIRNIFADVKNNYIEPSKEQKELDRLTPAARTTREKVTAMGGRKGQPMPEELREAFNEIALQSKIKNPKWMKRNKELIQELANSLQRYSWQGNLYQTKTRVKDIKDTYPEIAYYLNSGNFKTGYNTLDGYIKLAGENREKRYQQWRSKTRRPTPDSVEAYEEQRYNKYLSLIAQSRDRAESFFNSHIDDPQALKSGKVNQALLAYRRRSSRHDWMKQQWESGNRDIVNNYLDQVINQQRERQEENKKIRKSAKSVNQERNKIKTQTQSIIENQERNRIRRKAQLKTSHFRDIGEVSWKQPDQDIYSRNKPDIVGHTSADVTRLLEKHQSLKDEIAELDADEQAKEYARLSKYIGSYKQGSGGRLPGTRSTPSLAILHGQERVLSAREVDSYERMGIPGFQRGSADANVFDFMASNSDGIQPIIDEFSIAVDKFTETVQSMNDNNTDSVSGTILHDGNVEVSIGDDVVVVLDELRGLIQEAQLASNTLKQGALVRDKGIGI